MSLKASQMTKKRYEALFLIDTGATDCMAPASELEKAGVTRASQWE